MPRCVRYAPSWSMRSDFVYSFLNVYNPPLHSFFIWVLTFEKSHSEDYIFPVWGDWLRRYVRIPFRLASSLIWYPKTKQVNCFFLCWLYLIINTKTIDILFYGKKLSRIFNCANLARFDWNCGKNKNVLLFGSSIYSTTVKPKKQ